MRLLLILIILCLLGACDEDRKKAMLTNPDVYRLITIEGCDVKYVDRGSENLSFFLARCNNTTTVTNQYDTGGKHSRFKRNVTITNEAELQEQAAEIKETQEALAKLSDKEKKLLGIN